LDNFPRLGAPSGSELDIHDGEIVIINGWRLDCGGRMQTCAPGEETEFRLVVDKQSSRPAD
jgi:hypothetical protein